MLAKLLDFLDGIYPSVNSHSPFVGQNLLRRVILFGIYHTNNFLCWYYHNLHLFLYHVYLRLEVAVHDISTRDGSPCCVRHNPLCCIILHVITSYFNPLCRNGR